MAADQHGLTPKQEAFACAYVETGNASEAYRRAGHSLNAAPKTQTEAASRLLADSKVLARVEALQAEHAKRHNITVDSITAELEEAREAAMGSGQISAAVSAIMGKAKLAGLIVDKAEVKRTESGDIASITTNELEAVVRAGRAGAAEAAKSATKPDRVH